MTVTLRAGGGGGGGGGGALLIVSFSFSLTFELHQDKTIWLMLSKDSDEPGHLPSQVFAVPSIDEPHHEKTNVLHMRKQRRRSASR